MSLSLPLRRSSVLSLLSNLSVLIVLVLSLMILEGCSSSSGSDGGGGGGGQTGYTNSNLKGTYTFLAVGTDTFGRAGDQYEVGGVLVADGTGKVTGGEQTYSNQVGAHADSITGTYTIGSNGVGTITLQTGDSSVGVAGTETLSVVILSPSTGLISGFDTSATSSGSLALQTSTAMPTGGYAFSVLGVTADDAFVVAMGGILNIDNDPANGAISGGGSVMDLAEAANNRRNLSVSGTVSVPDAMGKVTVQLQTALSENDLSFDGYITDATRIQLVENDAYGTSAGTAYGQGSATGTFSDPGSFNGTFVFGFYGYNFAGIGTYAGTVTANGESVISSGQIDQVQDKVISDTLTGTYSANDAGNGRVELSTTFGNSANGAGPTMIFYLTSTGAPIPVLQMDQRARSAGTAYVQSSGTPNFNGTYGIGYTSATLSSGENDITGSLTVTNGAFSGTANENVNFNLVSSDKISGGFTAGNGGRFTGTVSSNATSAAVAYYFVNSGQAIVIQNDGDRSMLGAVLQQSAP